MRQEMNDVQMDDLPLYLRRYLDTRYGGLWREDLEESGSFVRHALTQRQEVGLSYLRETVNGVTFRALSLDSLLDALAHIDQSERPSLLVGEVVSRLDSLSVESVDVVAAALTELDVGDFTPAGRVTVDRAIQRIMPKLESSTARRLATKCLLSKRVNRRRAAYKFFKLHGLEDDARAILRINLSEGTLEAPDLVACDAQLVKDLGLMQVLAISSSTYYRMRAIQCAMEALSPADLARRCHDYPQELVWAVYDQRRVEYLPHLMDLLRKYHHDAYLLNRIVGCIAILGARDELAEAISVAGQALKDTASRQ